MKAVGRDRYGGPEVLELREVAKPTPGPDQVLVRVLAASVNDWDWGMLRGSPENRLLGGLLRPRVHILGCDIAGRVEAVGGAVTAFRPGDEVHGDLCQAGFGAFAEYVSVPETALVRKPAGMTFEQAASLPQAGMLAVQGLIDAGGIEPRQKVLLNGAGGGVGTIALQLAKLHGAEVTVVDGAGKLDMLLTLGADHVIDYRREDFTGTGERYDLILDVKTSRSPFAHARALAPNGAYVTVGGGILRLLQTVVLGPVMAWRYDKRMRIVGLKPNKDLAYLDGLFEAGKLQTVLDRRYALDELPEALRFYATGEHRGKIIVTMA